MEASSGSPIQAIDPDSNFPTSNKGLSPLEKVLIGVCAFVILTLLAIIILCFKKRRGGGGSASHDSLDGKGTMPIEMVIACTHNFDSKRVIGTGGFGQVFKGILENGVEVAVKKMKILSSPGTMVLDQFYAEIDILSQVRHRNLVSLFGYCFNEHYKLLVYEFVMGGTLKQSIVSKVLTWKERLLIALDIARACEYLHTFNAHTFVHRDLKSTNILLTEKRRAKVADFGLAKIMPDGAISIHTRLAGTFGYLDPEYAATGRVTTALDVYSFGVIFLELISGRPAVNYAIIEGDEEPNLVNWVTSRTNLGDVIDLVLQLYGREKDHLEELLQLARYCTSRQPSHRPDMGYVVSTLHPMVETWEPASDRVDNPQEEFTAGIQAWFDRAHARNSPILNLPQR